MGSRERVSKREKERRSRGRGGGRRKKTRKTLFPRFFLPFLLSFREEKQLRLLAFLFLPSKAVSSLRLPVKACVNGVVSPPSSRRRSQRARLVSLSLRFHREQKQKRNSSHLSLLSLLSPFPLAGNSSSPTTMEATVVVVDNSEWTRNGDYAPTRFQVSFVLFFLTVHRFCFFPGIDPCSPSISRSFSELSGSFFSFPHRWRRVSTFSGPREGKTELEMGPRRRGERRRETSPMAFSVFFRARSREAVVFLFLLTRHARPATSLSLSLSSLPPTTTTTTTTNRPRPMPSTSSPGPRPRRTRRTPSACSPRGGPRRACS